MKLWQKILTVTALIVMTSVSGCYLHIWHKEEIKMKDLNKTDPELAFLWGNFVNNEVKPQGNLDVKTRFLVLLSAHIATQARGEYPLILHQALDNGVSPVEAKEVVYQAIPYVGIAKVYDFLRLTNRVLRQRGIKLPLEEQSKTTPENRLEKGIAVQSSIFGKEHIDAMRASAPAELKHIQDYLSANCFGDYYTRSGLDTKTRELLTFSLLVSMGGADPQVKAHVQGNLNVGNNRQVLLDTVTQLLPYIGYPRSLNGITAINEIAKE